MNTGARGILVGATEFVHCCEILPQDGDYGIVSSLGEESVALKEQSPWQKSDPSVYSLPYPLPVQRLIENWCGFKQWRAYEGDGLGFGPGTHWISVFGGKHRIQKISLNKTTMRGGMGASNQEVSWELVPDIPGLYTLLVTKGFIPVISE